MFANLLISDIHQIYQILVKLFDNHFNMVKWLNWFWIILYCRLNSTTFHYTTNEVIVKQEESRAEQRTRTRTRTKTMTSEDRLSACICTVASLPTFGGHLHCRQLTDGERTRQHFFRLEAAGGSAVGCFMHFSCILKFVHHISSISMQCARKYCPP